MTQDRSQKNMWMVRAGGEKNLFSEFKSKNIVAIGWNDLGDLSKINNVEEIKEKLIEKYPDEGKSIPTSAGQVGRFRFGFQKGDYVITYSREERVYLVGEIIGDCQWSPELEYKHTRKIKWMGEVLRDKLTTSTKNTLGSILTIFKLNEDAEEEIIQQLSGKTEVVIDKIDEGIDTIKEDTIDKAHEFIKDQILKLQWDDAQRLVAGILRGMGYKTRISPVGPDRGKDIIASKDGLGLEDPTIIVEVKHRNGQMGSQEIRSFIAVLRPTNKGLYVSTGGFSKDAKYEAERANVTTSLIDLDELADLMVQYYDNFDSETRALIPLTKIYWPE